MRRREFIAGLGGALTFGAISLSSSGHFGPRPKDRIVV
jgi:hypothetical protein